MADDLNYIGLDSCYTSVSPINLLTFLFLDMPQLRYTMNWMQDTCKKTFACKMTDGRFTYLESYADWPRAITIYHARSERIFITHLAMKREIKLLWACLFFPLRILRESMEEERKKKKGRKRDEGIQSPVTSLPGPPINELEHSVYLVIRTVIY